MSQNLFLRGWVNRASASFLRPFSWPRSPPWQELRPSLIPSPELLPTPASEGPTSRTATASGRSGEGEGLGARPGWGLSEGRAEQQHHHPPPPTTTHHHHSPSPPRSHPAGLPKRSRPPAAPPLGPNPVPALRAGSHQSRCPKAEPLPPAQVVSSPPEPSSVGRWPRGDSETLVPRAVTLQATAASGW